MRNPRTAGANKSGPQFYPKRQMKNQPGIDAIIYEYTYTEIHTLVFEKKQHLARLAQKVYYMSYIITSNLDAEGETNNSHFHSKSSDFSFLLS